MQELSIDHKFLFRSYLIISKIVFAQDCQFLMFLSRLIVLMHLSFNLQFHDRSNIPCCRVVAVSTREEIGLVITAVKDIEKGEQLLQDYGREKNGPRFLFM